jgi:hypothetical protein
VHDVHHAGACGQSTDGKLPTPQEETEIADMPTDQTGLLLSENADQ